MAHTLDWKYPDLADVDYWAKAQCGVDLPEDVQRIGYAVVAERVGPGDGRRYVVCVRGGYYHLARYADPCDGRHLIEIGRTSIPYGGDDDEIIPVVAPI